MAAQLPTYKIGNTLVAAIGYGCMGLSWSYAASPPDEERLKVLDAVYDNGCTFWDTADVYHDSEDLLGKWCKRTGLRSKIFLSTKFGFPVELDPEKTGEERMINGDPAYVPKALERSLQRLGTDHIDLWYLHRADSTVPIELTVGAMAEQVKIGKVKYLGLSEMSADTLRRAHAVHPIAAIQVEYSPFALDIEDEKIGLLKVARELGVKIVAYSPLGRGILTGKYTSPDDFEPTDSRRYLPRFSKENFPNILKLADGLKEIAARHKATPGQVALAWLLGQGEDVLPIPGTTKIPSLKENLGAVHLKLTPEELQEVRVIAEKADASSGPRYPEAFMSIAYTDTPPMPK